MQRDKTDVSQAVLSLTLGLSLNGTLTNMIKLIVGESSRVLTWKIFLNLFLHPLYVSYANFPAVHSFVSYSLHM